MSNFTHDQVIDCILEHCGKSPSDLEPKQFQDLTITIAQMHGAAHVWQKPREIENQLEDVRTKLSDAMQAIKGLDNYAKALARRGADRESEKNFQELILKLDRMELSDDERRQQVEKICKDWNPQPKEEWVDYLALAAIQKLRNSLVLPIEKAIQNAPTGPGRPPNRRAYLVAEYAYILYLELTGEEPGFWEGAETPFSRLVSALYSTYGIRAGLKKPILAAMHKYKISS
ncbi:hypothetical protein [Profundibacter sp.]